MNAIWSNLEVLSLKTDIIDNKFDIFCLRTSQDHFSSLAMDLDEPVEKGKALSLVYKPRSKEAYALFEKGEMTSQKFAEVLNTPTIEVTSVSSASLAKHILIRLFLAALNNDTLSFLKFNNINGRLFLYLPELKKNKFFTACEIEVDKDLNFSTHAVKFVSTKFFRDNFLRSKPQYIINPYTNTLNRVWTSEKDKKSGKDQSKEETYIVHGLGKKAGLDFLRFDGKDDKYKQSRAYLMHQVLNQMNQAYADFLKLDFKKQEISRIIDTPENKKIEQKVLNRFQDETISMVNYCEDELGRIRFDSLLGQMAKDVKCSFEESLRPDHFNIVFMHDQDYYKDKEETDPYKSLNREEAVIQVVTSEDVGQKEEKEKNKIISALLKELVIKDDIRKGKITLADWSSYGFKSNYYFGFYDSKTSKVIFMKVMPDGRIELESKVMSDKFQDQTFDDLSKDLESQLKGEKDFDNVLSKDKNNNPYGEVYIIKDDQGNINFIKKTDILTLPTFEIFGARRIRGNAIRPKYLAGVTDINLYNFGDDKVYYYNVGPRGNGMQNKIAKASHIYQVKVLKGKEIISNLLPLMAVTFVKYGNFTVLPYPFKYLREAMEIARVDYDPFGLEETFSKLAKKS